MTTEEQAIDLPVTSERDLRLLRKVQQDRPEIPTVGIQRPAVAPS